MPGWGSQRKREQVKSDEGPRRALLDCIGDVADWEVANDPRWIGPARELVKAAHPDEPPLVVHPFAAGGSILLATLRLGCDAFASDVNPAACLVLKLTLEDTPRHGPELADGLRRVDAEIKRAAERELGEFYPPAPDGSTPIAYRWARMVRCKAPGCGAEIPLVRSFWLCKKTNRRRALRSVVLQPPQSHSEARPLPEPRPREGRPDRCPPRGAVEIRDRPRPGVHAPGQRAIGPLPARQRGESPVGRDAFGRAEVMNHARNEIPQEDEPITEDELLKRITTDPAIFGGKPIIRGMRIAVEHVLGMLAPGDSPERLLQEYPFLEPADIQACLVYAHRSLCGGQAHERIAGAKAR